MLGGIKAKVFLAALAAASGLFALDSPAARGDSITVALIGVTDLGGGLKYKWDYAASVSGGSSVVAPTDWFAIADFAGYLPGDAAEFVVPGWTLTDTSGLGNVIGGNKPLSVYDPTLPGALGESKVAIGLSKSSIADYDNEVDLILTYTASPVIPGGVFGSPIGIFSFVSVYGVKGPGFLLAADAGYTGTNNQAIETPLPPSGHGQAPLPAIASMGMSMFGLLGSGLLGRKLTRRKATVA